MATSKLPLAIGLAIAGVVFGLSLGLIGFFLGGAGHGWVSGIWSGLAVFILPVFGVALAYGKHVFGRVLLVFVVVAMIAVDGLILYMAWGEGSHYLHKLWAAPGGLGMWLFWLCLWLTWQFVVVGAVIFAFKGSRSAGPAATDRGA
jgi:hypothetical protein